VRFWKRMVACGAPICFYISVKKQQLIINVRLTKMEWISAILGKEIKTEVEWGEVPDEKNKHRTPQGGCTRILASEASPCYLKVRALKNIVVCF
jgi:hypothetical protein